MKTAKNFGNNVKREIVAKEENVTNKMNIIANVD